MNRTLAAPAATASRGDRRRVYLASDDSAWMTAHTLAIDGGLSG